jgi:hypothetical protein
MKYSEGVMALESFKMAAGRLKDACLSARMLADMCVYCIGVVCGNGDGLRFRAKVSCDPTCVLCGAL